MEEEVEVRLLTTTDTDPFRKIRLNSLLEDPDSWLATYEEEKDLPFASFSNKILYAQNAPIYGFYGLFEKGKLIAYAQLSSSYWNKKRHIVTIYDVCVTKDSRRKNVGTTLLNYIIGKCREVSEIEQIQLRVNSNNRVAMNFYEKLGFTKVSEMEYAVKELDGTYQTEIAYTYFLKDY